MVCPPLGSGRRGGRSASLLDAAGSGRPWTEPGGATHWVAAAHHQRSPRRWRTTSPRRDEFILNHPLVARLLPLRAKTPVRQGLRRRGIQRPESRSRGCPALLHARPGRPTKAVIKPSVTGSRVSFG